MTMQDIAAAHAARGDRCCVAAPTSRLHDDAPATARWQGGTARRRRATRTARRCRPTCRPSSAAPATRSRPAGCSAPGSRRARPTTHRAGARPPPASSSTSLEVVARSRSDTRGLLGMTGDDGAPVERGAAATCSCSCASLRTGVSDERLRALVDEGLRRSPVPRALQRAMPLDSRSRSRPRDGRAVGNPARRAPGRRDLHPRALHRAVVLPVAARRLRGAAARARRRARRDLPPRSPKASATSSIDDAAAAATQRRRRRGISAGRRAPDDLVAGTCRRPRARASTRCCRAGRAS